MGGRVGVLGGRTASLFELPAAGVGRTEGVGRTLPLLGAGEDEGGAALTGGRAPELAGRWIVRTPVVGVRLGAPELLGGRTPTRGVERPVWRGGVTDREVVGAAEGRDTREGVTDGREGADRDGAACGRLTLADGREGVLTLGRAGAARTAGAGLATLRPAETDRWGGLTSLSPIAQAGETPPAASAMASVPMVARRVFMAVSHRQDAERPAPRGRFAWIPLLRRAH
ncbi:MAG: hypothetical protein R3B57_12370 [Phycisphaerales bacterium]